MFNWPAYPFIRITLAFIAGILIGKAIGLQLTETHYLAFSALVFFILAIKQIIFPKEFNTIKGIGLLLLIASIAGFRLQSYLETETKQSSQELFQKTDSFTATIVSYPTKGSKYYSYEANIQRLIISDSIYAPPIKQKIKLYISTKDVIPTYQYGDLVHITANPFAIKPPKNPHVFDYANYMALSNIYFQAFTTSEKSRILTSHKQNTLMEAVFRLRAHFEDIIYKSVDEPKAQSIALALLLGIKDQLDPETKEAYSTAGAMHVLAVSGLHIGIIHFIIVWLFKPIRSRAFKKHVQPIISIALLWGYAMLTGFSPSILRAATMFSIIIYGTSLNRHPSIYNSIALSALMLLMFKPTHLFSVGFQLSYLAVLGIVYLHPKFQNLYKPTTWIGSQIWSLLSVSLAAQIATAPISIFYFHQFPSYFLISNLTVIPAAFIIMILGIIVLITNQFITPIWIEWLLNMTLKATNWIVKYIQNLPHSLIDWIYLSPLETILIYLLILYLLVFEHSKKMIWIKWAFVCSALVVLFKIRTIYTQSQKNQIIFYSTPQSTVIDHVSGLSAQLYALDSIDNQENISRKISPMRLHSYLEPMRYPSIFNENQYLLDSSLCFKVLNKRKFLFAKSDSQWNSIRFKIDTDYFILENNATQSLEIINSHFNYKTLILSTSNNYNTIKSIRKQADTLGVTPIVIQEGAYILDIKNY